MAEMGIASLHKTLVATVCLLLPTSQEKFSIDSIQSYELLQNLRGKSKSVTLPVCIPLCTLHSCSFTLSS